MTVFRAGTEWDTFIGALPGATVETNSSFYDSNFSRVALEFASSTTDPFYVLAENLGDIPEVWVHFRNGASALENYASTILVIYNSAGQGVLRLRSNTVSTGWQLEYWSGSAWTLIGSAFTGSKISAPIDIRCKVDNTVGAFEFWVSGTMVASLTGDTDFFSGSACDDVRIGGYRQFTPSTASEFIVADQSTVGMRVATLVPNANGANTAWTGAFGDVDESNINDGDFISSATATQIETFGLTNLSVAAAALTPVAVVASFRGRNAASGPQNIDPTVRTGGTDYFGASVAGLTTTFQSGYQNVWMTNPGTGLDWTPSEIDALEAGVRSAT